MRSEIAAMMDDAWTEPGFCVPNRATYPHQWLWDSCFHALVWIALDSGRGLTEVTSALASQDPDGFVPHMTYWTEPEAGAEFWGRPGTSTITQPPMYGHAIAELIRAGFDVPADLVARGRAGLLNLADRPRTPAGLIPVFHPWETGCDDSARWDDFLDSSGPSAHDAGAAVPTDRARAERWRITKAEMVGSLDRSEHGAAVGNERFCVGSIGFNALVAWNAMELTMAAPGGDERLVDLGAELTEAVAARWDGDRWVDDGGPAGRIRTVDAMLALLIDPRFEGFEALVDPDAYGAPFGPRGVHRGEPSYEPDVYWRGPCWPQLAYLLMVAAERVEQPEAEQLARALVAGAEQSGLAEYWNPESGHGLGAKPQSWAGLALLAADRLGI
jgi:hypothetical protein